MSEVKKNPFLIAGGMLVALVLGFVGGGKYQEHAEVVAEHAKVCPACPPCSGQ